MALSFISCWKDPWTEDTGEILSAWTERKLANLSKSLSIPGDQFCPTHNISQQTSPEGKVSVQGRRSECRELLGLCEFQAGLLVAMGWVGLLKSSGIPC